MQPKECLNYSVYKKAVSSEVPREITTLSTIEELITSKILITIFFLDF
jgi:hypothetical protein